MSTSFSTSAAATTTGTTSAQSTAEDSGPSSTSFLWDVGSDLDFDDGIPIGCKTKKIDFLFVISRSHLLFEMQDTLNAAMPKFIDIIETHFNNFDYHIMVVDADDDWGTASCTDSCPKLQCIIGEPCCIYYDHPIGDLCCNIPEYPCALLDQVGTCDLTLGAGVVFPAGYKSGYHPCKIDGGRRYLTKTQSDLSDTFACIARVGLAGGDRIGDALEAAVAPEINGPGGCNEGFYREDALLMVTLVSYSGESSLWGEYENWYWTLRLSKNNNPNSIIALNLGKFGDDDLPCSLNDTTCAFARQFTYNVTVNRDAADFVPGFKKATEMVESICQSSSPI